MTNAEVRQRTKVKDIVEGLRVSSNGPVQMGTNSNNVRRKNRKKEKLAAEDPMGLYVLEGKQQDSGHQQQKSRANELANTHHS